MTITLIILGIVVAAVAIIFIIAAMKPSHFAIQRSMRIPAPADKIFPFINDMHAFLKWSPFEKDPNIKRTFSGPSAGTGAHYAWDGNRQVGAGSCEIVESAPSKIVMKLNMDRPFTARNTVVFTLTPAGGGTDVTWQMSGPQPFMAKVMSTVINCDKMVGGEFDKGLTSLKALAAN